MTAGQLPIYTPLSDIVSGGEAVTRNSSDVGDLLGKSLGGVGIEIQRRTPIVSDPRVRGFQGGQVISTADGGFFFAARPDLDTIVSRIDSSLVQNIVVIKGPYTVRRGPGFTFIDIETLGTPRYQKGFEGHGSTSIGYKTNGDGWNGRQAVWGGGPDWGYRVGWDILAGNDYETGAHVREPSSYNMQNFDFALGLDLTENLGLEFKYFRTMQRDVQFPGALTDLTSLITDAFSMRVVFKESDWFRSTLDTWFNETRFSGDNLSLSKRNQIPSLDNLGAGQSVTNALTGQLVVVPPGLTLNLVTNGDNNSWGFRNATTFGRDNDLQITGGWDFRYTSQAINEFDTFFFKNHNGEFPFNFPVPRSRQIDPGLFLDGTLPIGERLHLKAGARFDFINSGIQQPINVPQPPPIFNPNFNPNDPNLVKLLARFPGALSNTVNADSLSLDLGPGALDQRHFDLWSAFATADFKLTNELTLLGAYGFAQRPPTLVELYGDGGFLALLQNGTTYVIGGNPRLNPEQLNQVDVGIKANYETLRAGVNGYYAFIHDYVTFTPLLTLQPNAGLVPGIKGFQFTNTPQASLTGVEAYGEYDLLAWFTPFATLSFVSGRDLSNHEPLAGIYPVDGRAGVRVHDPSQRPNWAVELSTRMVDGQANVATSLGEAPTAGFTIVNLRTYWLVRENLLLTAGIENLGNRNYQEAFDLRSATNGGVYQPGRNFYFGARLTY